MTEENSQFINEIGDHEVAISGPYWEEMEAKNGDDCRMALVLPLKRADGAKTTFRLYFTSTIATAGRNKGQAMFEVNAQACLDLGMSAPFSPAKIDELDGIDCRVTMAEDEYEGKTRIVAKYLDPLRRKPLDSSRANDIWSKMTGSASDTQTDAPDDNNEDHDDKIPF